MKQIMRSTFGRLFNKNWVLAATMICGARDTEGLSRCVPGDRFDN